MGWVADEVIEDKHSLPLDQDLAAGEYALYIGLYNSETLERLSILASSEIPVVDDRLLITSVTLQP